MTRKVFATLPKNLARQLGPWRVCELLSDGTFLILETHRTRGGAIRREMELRALEKAEAKP